MSTTQEAGPQAVSVEEAARRLGVSANHVRRAVSRGELASARLGKRVLVPLRAIERLLGGVDE